MNKKTENIDAGFAQMLLQEFLYLRRRAEEKRDEVTMKSMDVIVAGITDLTKAAEVSTGGKALRFTAVAFDIFSNLGKHPNDPQFLRKAGTHYLVEWRLPEVAVTHLKRSLALNSGDRTLPMLIEIASLAVQRKNDEAGSKSSQAKLKRSFGIQE